jgi:hypothetical protein
MQFINQLLDDADALTCIGDALLAHTCLMAGINLDDLGGDWLSESFNL